MSQPSLLPEPEPEFEERPAEPRLDVEPEYEPDRQPEPDSDASPPASALAAGATTLAALREAAAGCRACDLWRDATQTVFGEGPAEHSGAAAEQRIAIVFVGEQPGDREDVEGRPFVGPAGALFDRALGDAGIDRTTTYVTNTVKHFKWTPQDVRGAGFRGTGKRRIHAKPNAEEITACRPWLAAELETLRPRLVVCLGATAAQALLGKSFRVTRQRGQVLDGPAGLRYLATVHPSSILRTDPDRREAAYADLVDNLRTVAATIWPPAIGTGSRDPPWSSMPVVEGHGLPLPREGTDGRRSGDVRDRTRAPLRKEEQCVLAGMEAGVAVSSSRWCWSSRCCWWVRVPRTPSHY